MRIRPWTQVYSVLVMFMAISALIPAWGGTAEVVGRVVNSSDATIGGSRLVPNCTVFSGDSIDVGEHGVVLVNLSSSGRALLHAATHVRFNRGKGNFEAQLVSGTLAVERRNSDPLVVRTSIYRFEAQDPGQAEFVVAKLPNEKTTIATQHGRVLITEIRSGERYTLAEGLLAQLSPSADGDPGQVAKERKVIGNVASSTEATQNGKQLSMGGWIHDGDSISTGAIGRAVIQLLTSNHVTLDENTSADFSLLGDRVLLQLQNGTVVVENQGERSVLVEATRLCIEPGSAGPSEMYVTIKSDRTAYIEAIKGDVRIRDTQSNQVYILPAGENVVVPAGSTGALPLQPAAESGSAPSVKTLPAQAPPSPGVRGHSHTTLIIIGVAGGGGIAAAAAALAGGGGGGSSGPPASPIVP